MKAFRPSSVFSSLLFLAVAGGSAELRAAEGIGVERPADKATALDPQNKEAEADANRTEYPAELEQLYRTVVTADRDEEERFESPRGIESIGVKKVEEAQARSIPEALEGATGAMIQQTNRGAGAPILRGLIGPQNLILVDHLRFNTSTFRTGPNQYLATFDVFALDRIELVRGSSSVLYGDGAMGGVIHLITTDPGLGRSEPGLSVRKSAAYFSADDATMGRAEFRWNGDRTGLLFGGSYGQHGTLESGGGIEEPMSDYSNGSWRAKLRHTLSDTLTLTLAHFGAEIDGAGRADQLGQAKVHVYDNRDLFSYLRATYKGAGWMRLMRISVLHHQLVDQVARNECVRNVDDLAEDPEACALLKLSALESRTNLRDEVQVLGFESAATMDFFSRRLRLVAGAEGYDESVASRGETGDPSSGDAFSPLSRGNFSDGSTYRTIGIYGHGKASLWRFGNLGDELRLSGGVRYSHFAAFAPDVPGLNTTVEGPSDVDYSYQGLVGSAGIQVFRPRAYNFYLSFLQGFRAPNLQESTVLGDTGSKFEVPNPDLTPERSDTIEIGSRIILEPIHLEVAAFRSRLKDAMDEVPVEYNSGSGPTIEAIQRVNTAEALYHGIEVAAYGRWREFSGHANATWMEGDYRDSDGDSYPARRVPPLFGALSFRQDGQGGIWHAGLRIRWALGQDRLHPSDEQDLRICETAPYSGVRKEPCDGTPGYVVSDLLGGWMVHERLKATLALRNLGDISYRVHGSGFNNPGFDLRATLNYRY